MIHYKYKTRKDLTDNNDGERIKQSKAKQSKALTDGALFVDPIFGVSCLKERVSQTYILEVF